jgi:hypothetical protein
LILPHAGEVWQRTAIRRIEVSRKRQITRTAKRHYIRTVIVLQTQSSIA